MMEYNIIPSIYGFCYEEIKQDLIDMFLNGVSWMHFDVMDASLSKIQYDGLSSIIEMNDLLSKYKIKKNVHLITRHPLKYIDCIAGLNIQSVSFHSAHLTEEESLDIVSKYKKIGANIGTVITPVNISQLNLRNNIDFIHICKSNYDDESTYTFEEISTLVKSCEKDQKPIQIDGGVSLENLKAYKDLGIHVFISGSGIFNGQSLCTYNKMKCILTNSN